MHLLVIDGNSIINRAFYGVRALANHKGVFTNALFGFFQMYLKEIETVKPDAVAVAFDLKSPTFRHKADAAYKANRKGMPEELAMQMPYLKQILTAMGIPVLSAEGFEADDILGTLAHACDAQGAQCSVMTGDRDSLQLITERVTVRLVKTKETIPYTPERFTEEYGFAPIHIIDLKALMGDSSDNIPGIKGIGEKTAMALIQAWNSIEAMYEHIDEVQATPRIRQKLIDGRPDAEHSKWLATIVTNAPVSTAIEDYRTAPQDTDTLRRLLTELELYKLLDRLGLAPLGGGADPTLFDEDAAQEEAAVAPELTETAWTLPADDDTCAYLLQDGTLTVLNGTNVMQTAEESDILAFLGSNCRKLTDDAKPHYRYALAHGTALRGIAFDAAICGYLLNPSATDYSTAAVCAVLNVRRFDELGSYADLCALQAMYEKGIARLEDEGMLPLWRDIELPLTDVLASMEHTGVLVDQDGIRSFGEQLTTRIDELAAEIYEAAGEEFNISSPKQLGVILFEKLGLPAKKKTKSGWSTNAEVLEELSWQHPIVAKVLEYRQYTKLRSTYVDGLLSAVAEDGRIHTNYRQTETRTGRLSSTEPNLQNIPVRTELGRQMRKFFKAAPGCILLDADYSQIELRLMAHLSGDAAMQEAFISGADIHTATAAKVFGCEPEEVTPEMRSASKAVNFGILYGMGAFSLSKDIHVSVPMAKQYIADYLGSFPKVSTFLDSTVENAARDGYVCTMLGRRRYVPELQARNKMVQAAGKRIAMNTPVQGTAADLIKLAMVHVHERLAQEVPSAKLILQVHDELIVEVPSADADAAAKVLHEEMLHAAELSVPLTADVNRGETWYDAKG
ncbi:MAG: DNA polymerase I [Oscillospiraceae bacterium]|nr:DNA polymerase I [Oscillospiraceae bacterium]